MVAFELAVLVIALIGFVLAVHFRRSIRALAVNAIVGLVVLWIGQLVGIGVQITLLAVLVCAIAGLPGAILVLILAYLDIAFAAMLLV